jgi:hypothetical protein
MSESSEAIRRLPDKQRLRLETLISRALHTYVCGRLDPEVPECLQRARKVIEEWEAERANL